MEIKKAFGRLLRDTREKLGFSREKLAELSELEYTFIYLLETGKRQPTLTTIFLLARALKVSPSKLIAEVEATKPTFSGRGETSAAASLTKPQKKKTVRKVKAP